MKVKFLGMAEEDDNLKERIDNAGNIQGCSPAFLYINSLSFCIRQYIYYAAYRYIISFC